MTSIKYTHFENMIWLNPVSDFWLNTHVKYDMTRMTRLAGSKHLNTGKSRVSVKACYTPTDTYRLKQNIYRTTRIKHAEVIQQEDIFRLYAVLFNLLIKMHRARRHPSGLHSAWFLRTRLTVKIFELPLVVATVTILLVINVMSDFVLNFTSKRFFSSAGVIN